MSFFGVFPIDLRMQKSDIRILIIEDDPTLGRAIAEGLTRSGYSTNLVSTPAQAQTTSDMTDYHGIVADCMLPQKSGVELATDIIKNSTLQPVLILISGIYKDPIFAMDAVSRTKAFAFLNKPFDILELINKFDTAFSHLIEHKREPLFEFMTQQQFSLNDKLNALAGTESLHGFDLPLVYTFLMDPQITGELSIYYEDRKKPTIIGFQNGTIHKVNHEDSQSYFGALLLEKGFVSARELQEALRTQGDVLVGKKLIENSSLSPHAVDIIKHEQMLIRISKTIVDAHVRIKFNVSTPISNSVHINSFLFTQLLNDWICSKITSKWLRSFYTPWLESPVVRGVEFGKINILKDLTVAASFSNILIREDWPHKLFDLISQNSQNKDEEDDILRGLHFFTLQRVVAFGAKTQVVSNFEVKISRVKKLIQEYQNKNHYEVLNVSQKAQLRDIHSSYHDLAKIFHPDTLPPQSPAELKILTQNIFSIVTNAYQVLSNKTKRDEYNKILELGHAENILKAETSLEEALRFMQKNKNREARKTLEKLIKTQGARSDVIVYYLWALIKEKRRETDHYELAEQVEKYLNRVPHEDRHSAQYFLVKGMYYELTDQIQKAYQYLKHSSSLNPSFLDPKREIAYIKEHYANRKKTTFKDDVSVVVTQFFKKSK